MLGKNKKTKPDELNKILKEVFFDRSKVIIQEPVITIGGKTVARPDNLICFAGLPKARKTTFVMSMVAACVTGKTYFDIQCKKGKVVFIDTEQSHQDHLTQIERTEKMIGKNFPQNLFTSFCFRKYSLDVLIECIIPILEKTKPSYLVLDAITEMVYNVNDMEESKKLTEFLKFITSKYNLVVIGVMHLSKSNNFTLGSLGSAIDRVAQSLLIVTKDEESGVSILASKYLRSDDHFKPIGLRYDPDQKIVIQCDPVNIKEAAKKKWNDKEMIEHFNICEIVFTDQNMLKYDALVDRLKGLYGRGTTIVKTQIIPFLIHNGFVVNSQSNYILGKFINKKHK